MLPYITPSCHGNYKKLFGMKDNNTRMHLTGKMKYIRQIHLHLFRKEIMISSRVPKYQHIEPTWFF